MATGRENSDWHESGLIRRDFRQDHGGGPEVPRHKGKRTQRDKRWCKGKEGREHRFEQRLRWSYTYTDAAGVVRERNSYNWVCAGCGKTEWSQPRPPIPKHDHHYCITKISERWKREEIYEQCCVCGGKGRSYSFYHERYKR